MLLMKPKNYQNVKRWHDSLHHAAHTQPICKVKFAKIRNFAFFLIKTWLFHKNVLSLQRI